MMRGVIAIAFVALLMSYLVGAQRRTAPVAEAAAPAAAGEEAAMANPEWRSTGAEFVERANGNLVLAAALWSESDPALAAAWVETFPDAEEREQAVAAVATAWADRDPEAAANFLLDHTEPGQTRDNAVVGILQRLAFQQIEKADAWSAEFPDELRERAVAQLNRIRERTATP